MLGKKRRALYGIDEHDQLFSRKGALGQKPPLGRRVEENVPAVLTQHVEIATDGLALRIDTARGQLPENLVHRDALADVRLFQEDFQQVEQLELLVRLIRHGCLLSDGLGDASSISPTIGNDEENRYLMIRVGECAGHVAASRPPSVAKPIDRPAVCPC